jgi:hypothetical protein
MANTWDFKGVNLKNITGNNHSEIFGQRPGLLASSSTTGSVRVKYVNYTNIESSPFTVDDIGPILEILSNCPEKVSMSRVFRQHSYLGTCWYDSLIMMIFENQDIKPYIIPFVEVAFRIYLENGINDLSYSSVRDKTAEEIIGNQNAFQRMKNMGYYNQNNEYNHNPKLINSEYKLKLLARTFQTITGNPDTITIYSWQFLAKSIQKYMLLGYLFHKNPGEIPKSLRQRRISINSPSFEYMHGRLRNILGASYCGVDDRVIRKIFLQFTPLLNFITKGHFSIIPYLPDAKPLPLGEPYASMKPNDIPAWMKQARTPENWWKERNLELDRIEGYYMVLKRKGAEHLGHVLCLYKCDKHWTIFDTDIGIVPLNAEDSDKISSMNIKTLNYAYLPPPKNMNTNGTIQYNFVFNDDSSFVIDIPFDNLSEPITSIQEYIFKPSESYKLINKPIVAAITAVREGGKRRTLRKYKRRNTRKHKKSN